ncbi:hypothetical protein [Actinomadura sp. DC4]|uniref:hypothetical protein n=1 Tax=Actinomadura sp. DC4 TaxID=3055069 RepID=UPI0025B27758|nr:hypothetical protein [Actinomadura sp. DC4]MDN3354222.1 hypothetical protein [Actinomadura sp. DC4]
MRLLPLSVVAGLLTACSSAPASTDESPRPTVAKAAPSPTAEWVAGQCVTASFEGDTEPTGPSAALPCTAPGAAGQIIKVVTHLRDCPSRTDGTIQAPAGGAVCVRNVAAPHPADPGKGGGILRVGDCIYSDDDAEPKERPCYDRQGPGKIRSFLRKKSQCHDDQGHLDGYFTTRREDEKRPVICHGEGANVLDPGPAFENGECVKKPATFNAPLGTMSLGLDTIDCDAESAWARVVATVLTHCPAKSTDSAIDINHYPSTTCLRRL